MFVVEKTYPVKNLMFKIDIENTRTQGAKYVQNFFTTVDFEHVFVCSVISYLPFHCLDDFDYLDRFQRHNDAGGLWRLSLRTF